MRVYSEVWRNRRQTHTGQPAAAVDSAQREQYNTEVMIAHVAGEADAAQRTFGSAYILLRSTPAAGARVEAGALKG